MRADAKWYCQVNPENDPITEDEEDEIAFQAAINVLRDSVESGKNGLRLRLPSCTSAPHCVSLLAAVFINAISSMILAWSAKMKQKKQPALEPDEPRIDDAVLALLYLNLYHCGVAWKSFDWDALNRLHEKGLISDPVRKAKSVGFSEEGEKRAREIFEQMFVVCKI